jgi:hypothetical protein
MRNASRAVARKEPKLRLWTVKPVSDIREAVAWARSANQPVYVLFSAWVFDMRRVNPKNVYLWTRNVLWLRGYPRLKVKMGLRTGPEGPDTAQWPIGYNWWSSVTCMMKSLPERGAPRGRA